MSDLDFKYKQIFYIYIIYILGYIGYLGNKSHLVGNIQTSITMYDLNFNSNVKEITKSAFYHLTTNIARYRGLLSRHDLQKLIHAFISSRVDFCNGLFVGLPKKTIKQLQLLLNAAAIVLTKTKEFTTFLQYLNPYNGFQLVTELT